MDSCGLVQPQAALRYVLACLACAFAKLCGKQRRVCAEPSRRSLMRQPRCALRLGVRDQPFLDG